VAVEPAESPVLSEEREEALFAGASSGANVVAGLRLAERLVPAATVVTLLVDSRLKYLTTDVYRDAEHAALSEMLPLMSPRRAGDVPNLVASGEGRVAGAGSPARCPRSRSAGGNRHRPW